MANWCQNIVYISGPKAKLDAIEHAANNKCLLNTLSPLQDHEYNAVIEAWGTKWDPDFVDARRDHDESLALSFETAWSPPVNAFEKYLETNKDVYVTLYYLEYGMDFAGIWQTDKDECWDGITELFRENDNLNSDLEDLDLEFNIRETVSEWEQTNDA